MTAPVRPANPWWYPAYRLVRPVVRPLAWRLRTFLVGRLHDDMADLRTQLEAMRAQMEALRVELRERADEQLHATDRRIVETIDQALLTMALDRERR